MLVMLTGTDSVDFMVHGIFSYSFFGQKVWITTTHVCLLILVILLIVFAMVSGHALRKGAEVPGTFQNIVEMAAEAMMKLTESTMGRGAPGFYNYIATIFLFIGCCNISGLFGLRPPTADYGVTLPLAVITLVLIHGNRIKNQRPSEIWRGLCSPLPPWLPLWVPVNVISELAVPISLSLRLFANVLSGVIMLSLVYGLLGWAAALWPAFLHAYFDLFSGAIQTYVFCMLTMTYLTAAAGREE